MTDKEKEAIESLKDMRLYSKDTYREYQLEIETVVNLIQTQQEEIDRLIDVKCHAESGAIDLLKENQKKDKIIDEMANKLHKLALYYDDEGTYCEMKNEICDEVDNVEDIHKHCTSCIKQYFINKVEKGE